MEGTPMGPGVRGMTVLTTALVCAGLLAWSCGGGDDGCPAGTIPQAGTCVSVPDSTPHEFVIKELPNDSDILDDPGGEPADLVDDATVETDADPGTDAPIHDVFPGGVIGRSCNKDLDCKLFGIDGVCLDWPKGYCTILNCDGDDGPCPEGALCLALTPNAFACAAACDTSAQCRLDEGYGCKKIPDPLGEPVSICYQVKKENGPAEGCSGHQDCAGNAACLTAFSGGYCADLWCGLDAPCGYGTACVLVNDLPACLKECEVDPDCIVEGDLPRTCAKMKSAITLGDKVKVCASGTLGVPIGGQCLTDMECDSENCEVVYTGKCSFSKDGCLLDSDCTDGGICQQSVENAFGYCTSECSLSGCPGESFCIGASIAASGKVEGKCLPGCQGPGDQACRPEAGLTCLFGDPVGSLSHYSCANLPSGKIGSPCKAPSECESGQCLVAGTGGGYCTGPCGFQGFCPFPSSCQQVGIDGQYRCLLRCLSGDDCPPGHSCQIPPGAVSDVCYP